MPRTGFPDGADAALGAGRLAESSARRRCRSIARCASSASHRAAAARSRFYRRGRRAFAAYAAGVNAWVAARHGALTAGIPLLRFSPEPWRAADSLVWGKLMDLQLAGNFRSELLRARMARTIPAADLAVLYPEYPKDAPTTLTALRPFYRRLDLDRLYRALPPRSVRSTPRTIGSSTAGTARAASRCSPTTRICRSAHPASGIWRGSRPRRARSPAPRHPACRSS